MVYFLYEKATKTVISVLLTQSDTPPKMPDGYEEFGMTNSKDGLAFDESLINFKDANEPANTRPTA